MLLFCNLLGMCKNIWIDPDPGPYLDLYIDPDTDLDLAYTSIQTWIPA